MLDPVSFASESVEFNMDGFRPNKKHPWVQGVLAGLPSFRVLNDPALCPFDLS